MMKEGRLTPKQAQFVREYLIDLNATQAAIRAGFSPSTAKEQASRLLTNVNIAAAVKAAMDERARRTEITSDRVLEEFARIGFADVRELVKWDEERTCFVPSAELTREQAAAISGVKSRTRTTRHGETEQTTCEIEVKTYDKVQALTQIGRHLGMFNDKLEVDDVSGLTQEERVARLAAIANKARARRSGSAPNGE